MYFLQYYRLLIQDQMFVDLFCFAITNKESQHTKQFQFSSKQEPSFSCSISCNSKMSDLFHWRICQLSHNVLSNCPSSPVTNSNAVPTHPETSVLGARDDVWCTYSASSNTCLTNTMPVKKLLMEFTLKTPMPLVAQAIKLRKRLIKLDTKYKSSFYTLCSSNRSQCLLGEVYAYTM